MTFNNNNHQRSLKFTTSSSLELLLLEEAFLEGQLLLPEGLLALGLDLVLHHGEVLLLGLLLVGGAGVLVQLGLSASKLLTTLSTCR